MYDELVNSLRICGKMRSVDDYCVAFHDGCCEAEPVCMYELMMKAADAIEELQKRVPKRPHGRLIDADALIEDLKYDVELDAVVLDSMEIVGDERRKIQDDKDFKQNSIFWIENAPTIIPAEEG